MEIKCVVCGKIVYPVCPSEQARNACMDCIIEKKEQERKTYGWFVYRFLNIHKKFGKFIIPNEEFTEDKYGLQQIFVNHITNTIALIFYFGRSMCHRPRLEVPLNSVEKFRNEFLNMIKGANKINYSCDGRQRIVEEIYEKIKELM